jgi:hypothetical protein
MIAYSSDQQSHHPNEPTRKKEDGLATWTVDVSPAMQTSNPSVSTTDTSPRSANRSSQGSKFFGTGTWLVLLVASGVIRTAINSHFGDQPRQASPAAARQAEESTRRFMESMQNRPTWQRALEELISFEFLIRDYPKNAVAYNGHARLLATFSDKQFRKAAEWELAHRAPQGSSNIETRAVDDAMMACKLTDWKKGSYVDTLAAASASAGDFDAAVKWEMKALELVAGQEKADFESRLALYKAHKPYRDETIPRLPGQLGAGITSPTSARPARVK